MQNGYTSNEKSLPTNMQCTSQWGFAINVALPEQNECNLIDKK